MKYFETREEALNFALLVERMRKAQKAYFKCRSGDTLRESMNLEKEVDSVLKTLTQTQGQLNLE